MKDLCSPQPSQYDFSKCGQRGLVVIDAEDDVKAGFLKPKERPPQPENKSITFMSEEVQFSPDQSNGVMTPCVLNSP